MTAGIHGNTVEWLLPSPQETFPQPASHPSAAYFVVAVAPTVHSVVALSPAPHQSDSIVPAAQ